MLDVDNDWRIRKERKFYFKQPITQRLTTQNLKSEYVPRKQKEFNPIKESYPTEISFS